MSILKLKNFAIIFALLLIKKLPIGSRKESSMDEKNPLEQFEEFCKNNSFEYVKGWVDGMQSVLNILSMELSKKNGSTSEVD